MSETLQKVKEAVPDRELESWDFLDLDNINGISASRVFNLDDCNDLPRLQKGWQVIEEFYIDLTREDVRVKHIIFLKNEDKNIFLTESNCNKYLHYLANGMESTRDTVFETLNNLAASIKRELRWGLTNE